MQPTAYFSAEIGFSTHIPTYSGGLGVLAGDHLKAAADAGLPLVGVTLLYRQGYFRQHIGADGWQGESYPLFAPEPLLQKLPQGVDIELQGRRVHVALWRTQITGATGHIIDILFLDTDLPENTPFDRSITYRLYGGDHETRILQEAVLGFAGVKAISAVYPHIERYHLNEGHTAFVPLALVNMGRAPEQVRKTCHFTTHTPVPAGHDVFPYSMASATLRHLLPKNIEELAGYDGLSMSLLALNLCGSANGVSALHGQVAREMFPSYNIGHVTNGVHHLTWVSQAMAKLYDAELPGWRHDTNLLKLAEKLSDSGVVAAHQEAKQALLQYANADCGLGYAGDILTIGFARRAAAYKRAALLFQDVDRLIAICGGRVQFIFAGKAHPRDEAGHRIIQEIFHAGQRVGEHIRVGYINNYNMWSGALITAGADVWLNTPLRPHEASGTSGMKAALNGVPNASIADGWWAEGAKDGQNGWIIGDPAQCDDDSDAEALYRLLEHQIIPTYYEQQQKWAGIMKQAIVTGAQFTAARMIDEYRRQYYG